MVYDKDFVSSQPEKSKKHNIDSFDDVVPRVCPFSFNVTDMPLEADKEMFYSLYHDGYRARNRKKKWIGNKDVLIPPFNFKVDYVDSKYWFHDLICSDKCFTDSHLNVAFYYLKKMRRCFHLMNSKVVCLWMLSLTHTSGTFGCIIRSTKTNGRRLIFQNMLCCKNMYWVL